MLFALACYSVLAILGPDEFGLPLPAGMHHAMHHAMHYVMHYAMHYVMHYVTLGPDEFGLPLPAWHSLLDGARGDQADRPLLPRRRVVGAHHIVHYMVHYVV